MPWTIIFVIVFTAAIPVAAKVGMPRWGWIVIATIIVVADCAIMGKASPSWELKHVIASWFFLIILPWVAITTYLWFSRYPARPWPTAIGVPVVFVVALAMGLLVGDMSGLVPQ
jgi:hypothetical protein